MASLHVLRINHPEYKLPTMIGGFKLRGTFEQIRSIYKMVAGRATDRLEKTIENAGLCVDAMEKVKAGRPDDESVSVAYAKVHDVLTSLVQDVEKLKIHAEKNRTVW